MKQNLINKTYGRLKVISQYYKAGAPRADRNGYKDRVLWCFCQCACGNPKLYDVRATSLKNKACRSCGCLNNEVRAEQMRILADKHRKYDPIEATAIDIFREKYADGDMLFDYWKLCVSFSCIYCGSPPSNHTLSIRIGGTTKFTDAERTFTYQGLDRIISSKPHNANNCVPACIICNRAKNDMQIATFLSMAISIAQLNAIGRPNQQIPSRNDIERFLIKNNLCTEERWNTQKRDFLARTELGGELGRRFGRYKPKSTLSMEELMFLSQQNCYYCGSSPLNWIRCKESNIIGFYNGLDRIDNSVRTYTAENTVTACILCNIAKRNRSKEDFLFWADKVFEQIKNNALLQSFLLRDEYYGVGNFAGGAGYEEPSGFKERLLRHDLSTILK